MVAPRHDPIGLIGRTFLVQNVETMLRLLIAAAQNPTGEIMPELHSEIVGFRQQAIKHGIDVIALSEEASDAG